MRDIDYIKRFAVKHKFKGVARIESNSLYLSNEDCPVSLPVSMDDIIFDVISDLPEECFKQWMNHRLNNDISFKDWISSGCSFVPDGVDQTGMEKVKKDLFEYVEQISNSFDERWKLSDDSD